MSKRAMESDDKPPGANGATAQERSDREERPFDIWLRKQLHAIYDGVAKEPLPEDLLKLIEDDGRRTRESKRTDIAKKGDKGDTGKS